MAHRQKFGSSWVDRLLARIGGRGAVTWEDEYAMIVEELRWLVDDLQFEPGKMFAQNPFRAGVDFGRDGQRILVVDDLEIGKKRGVELVGFRVVGFEQATVIELDELREVLGLATMPAWPEAGPGYRERVIDATRGLSRGVREVVKLLDVKSKIAE